MARALGVLAADEGGRADAAGGGRALRRLVNALHLRRWALWLGLAVVIGGCPDWNPVRGLVVGEGMQRSPPSPLAFEHGVRPITREAAPPYAEVGTPVRASLAAPWAPIRLDTPSRDCFAIDANFGDHASDLGPLTWAVRARGPRLVLRAPDGTIVAELAGELVHCNEAGVDYLLLDLVARDGESFVGPVGTGTMTVTLFVRALGPVEQWQRDARATPVGGIDLWDPEGVRKPTGARATRQLEDFEPLPLTLAPASCSAVKVALAPDATPASGLRMADAPLRFEVGTSERLYAHRVVAGARVTDEVCNLTGDTLQVELRMEPRAGVELGDGDLALTVYSRPIQLAAPRSRFLARPFAPPDDPRWHVITQHETRLERFTPLPLSVPEGACQAVRLTLGPGARVARGATHDSHLLIYRDRGDSHIAHVEEGATLFVRPFCNVSRMGPWALTVDLVARDGRAPGRGALIIEVLERPL